MLHPCLRRLNTAITTLTATSFLRQAATARRTHNIRGFSTHTQHNVAIHPDYTTCFDDPDIDPRRRRAYRPPILGGFAPVDSQKDPFHAAIPNRDILRLKELLASHPLPSYTPLHEYLGTTTDSDLHNASESSDLGLEEDSWELPSSAPNGTPLQFAACFGNFAAVDAILQSGVDPLWAVRDHKLFPMNHMRNEVYYPVHLATVYGHRKVAVHLLEHYDISSIGAVEVVTDGEGVPFDPSKPRNVIEQSLYLASHGGHVEILQDLLSTDFIWSPTVMEEALCVAAGKWDPHVIFVLLQHGEKPYDYPQEALDRALCIACDRKSDDLLSYGDGPLYSGIDYVHQPIVITHLIKSGANANYGPLLTKAARDADKTGALKALLENGADPNISDSQLGETALHIIVGTVMYHPTGPTL